MLNTNASTESVRPEYFFGFLSINFSALHAKKIETIVSPILNKGIQKPKLKINAVFP